VTPDLVVLGAAGFGRETLDVVAAVNRVQPTWNLIGVVDDAPSETNLERLAALGVRHLGGLTEALALTGSLHFVVAIGAPGIRERLAHRCEAAGWQPATLVHPSATVGALTRLGAGTVLCAGVAVSTNVDLGRHVHLNPNVTVGHDTSCADFVSLNPGAIVSGDCRIGTRCLVGAGAVVLQGLSVGPDTVVGAAACLTKDAPSGVVVTGVPGRWAGQQLS
jgi:sugar O-acyltransferase (sialic acid O-acetyltransferase NeuD family)